MNHEISLVPIPPEQYSDYRYEVIFKAYKWDPQVEDHNTLSPYVLMLSQTTADQLKTWAEQLSAETIDMEEALIRRPDLTRELGLPKKILRAQSKLAGYDRNQHVRMMRFDFHPTVDGWSVSEVNSDVPGGFAESSVLPEMVSRYFDGCSPEGNFARSLLQAFQARVKPGGTIAFVHATSYSDDRQIIQFIHDYFAGHGFKTLLLAPDHVRWVDGKAFSVAAGNEGGIDGIVRYFPVEWLTNLPRKSSWEGAYSCETTSCNHPVVILTQSKRLPLVWDRLEMDLSGWRALLPATKDPREIRDNPKGWVYKPALGRVGQGISIEEAVSPKELKRINRFVRKHPKYWVAQQRFMSQPYPAGETDRYHLCVGVFTINSKFAGFYGRMSPYPRIDVNATDIPILVRKEHE